MDKVDCYSREKRAAVQRVPMFVVGLTNAAKK